MKKILFAIAASVVLLACNNEKSKESTTNETKASTDSLTARNGDVKQYYTQLVDHYLALKNALVSDNANEAASAAAEIKADIEKMGTSQMHDSSKKAFNSVKLEITEHAEHIKDSKSDIAHQREHFDLLSQDVMDLVKGMGSDRPLFLTYCPMYNNKKGAYWLSEIKEVRNPYYGQEMLTCGEVKEEITKK